MRAADEGVFGGFFLAATASWVGVHVPIVKPGCVVVESEDVVGLEFGEAGERIAHFALYWERWEAGLFTLFLDQLFRVFDVKTVDGALCVRAGLGCLPLVRE